MRSLVVLFALVAAALAVPSATVEKRSLGHVVAYSVPSAVSHQSRVDVHSSPVEYAVVSEPVVAARTVAVSPALYTGASAVSHQSRVDVQHSPAVVTSYASPVVAQQVVAAPAVYEARSVHAPVAAVYSAPSAVSHQSRVDYKSSPAVFETRSVYAPSVYSRSVYAPSVYSHSVYAPSVYAPSAYASYW